MLQKTVSQVVSFEGVGVHSGKHEKICCYPTPEDHGIIFEQSVSKVKIIIGKSIPIATDCATVFAQEEWRLSTVEHFIAACAGLGIDNLMVHVEGNEIPILDGSSALFIKKFLEVGIKTLKKKSRRIRILDTVFIEREDRFIELKPYDEGLSISIFMTRPVFLKDESYSTDIKYQDQTFFCQNIIPARTFGEYDQWNYLKRNGFALGASLENTLVRKDESWMQELQWNDEPVRHKVLDCYGDLFLLGGFLCAQVNACNPGHALHRELLLYLKQTPSVWEFF